MSFQVNSQDISTFIKDIIKEQANKNELEWIEQQEEKLRDNVRLNSFYFAFSSAPRFIRKTVLQLTEEQLSRATEIHKGFQPGYWSLLQAVRTYFLLMLPVEDMGSYEKSLSQLFETADIDEQVTLYKALSLLPFPKVMAERAKEGIRTNITDVFDAIALNNPYPSDFLEQEAWNQMVLKAVFMQRPLYRIYGSDERANPELSEMLINFAHERWAANRKVTPELWRFVGPFMNSTHIADITKVIEGDLIERQAGLLACSESELPMAQELFDQHSYTKGEIQNGRLNWTVIGENAASG